MSGRDAALAKRALAAIDRQALHAEELSFEHPKTGETMTFRAPPPPISGGAGAAPGS